MRARKSLGQHFLMHARIAERITDAALLSPLDTVVEIGPGTGTLTRALLKRAIKVIGIEADAGLAHGLEQTFAAEIALRTFELTFADIRGFDIENLPPGYKLVANIPYYLTGDILRRFLSAQNQPSSMTLLVQKEVAERIARSKKESLLSLSVKAYGVPKYEFTVPRGAFVPAPKVDSAVLTIKNISRKHFTSAAQEQRFFELILAGFAHKRKLLASNLKNKGFSVPSTLENKRAEDVPLTDWLSLAE